MNGDGIKSRKLWIFLVVMATSLGLFIWGKLSENAFLILFAGSAVVYGVMNLLEKGIIIKAGSVEIDTKGGNNE